MTDTELFFTLSLIKTEGVGDVVAKKLINHFQSARNVFEATKTDLAKVQGIGTKIITQIQKNECGRWAEKELQFIKDQNLQSYAFNSVNYPEKLKHCADAPVLLFYSGQQPIASQKCISIVGTRQITPHGTEFCQQLIADLAAYNPCIISGFAYGTDITAHLAAVQHNLQTIAVMAHGLNHMYPKSHTKYTSKIHEKGGFLTEFWSDRNPDKENFVKRNRIVAGISEATIVIESAAKGGSLITATMAGDYDRDVFAVPGRTTDKYSQGCNVLIKNQQAQLITSAADLLYYLNWDDAILPEKSIQKQLFIELTEDETKIMTLLQEKGSMMLDEIAQEITMPVYKLAGKLVDLELKGLVRPLPGKLFELI